jgi:STE24 endopeptidase
VNEDKSSRYHRLKRQAGVAATLTTGAVLAGLLLTGASSAIATGARWIAPGAVRSTAVYVALLAVVQEATAFPMVVYRSFLLERRYGLSTEPWSVWMRDQAKASALGFVLALAGAEIVYWLLRHAPHWWWLLGAGGFALAMVLMAKVAPILLLPIFYKFKPLEREALRARLLSLATRAGVPVLGVYEWGLGEKTRRANAALVGTGRTRRIIVSDTLLDGFSEDEIEVVLAHELGHHVHRDIFTALGTESALVLASFGGAAAALHFGWRALGLGSPADIAGLPLLMIAGGAVTLAARPLVNGLSRRNERRADSFALAVTRQPAAFISAMAPRTRSASTWNRRFSATTTLSASTARAAISAPSMTS